MSTISVQSLTKKYGTFTAVDDFSFDVRQGETFGLLGTNGAGKSTTIQILTGLLLPTSGKAEILGINPSTDPKKLHPLIGYIPDTQSLYDDLSTFENIDLFRKIHRLDKKETHTIIERFDLGHKGKVKVKSLSKGLRQRVLIARSILHRPKVLFLDEPTSGLDPSSANTICQFLEELKKEGTTILLTTHLMNEADRLCDRIIFIDKGKKIEEGSPLALKMKYKKNQIKMVTYNNDQFLTEHKEFSTATIFDDLKKLHEQKTLVHFQTHSPTLEEVFIQIIKDSHT